MGHRSRSAAMIALMLVSIAAGAARAEPSGGRELPRITRRIPDHRVSLLDGCTSADRTLILDRIGAAIELGAPTYNAGTSWAATGSMSALRSRSRASCLWRARARPVRGAKAACSPARDRPTTPKRGRCATPSTD